MPVVAAVPAAVAAVPANQEPWDEYMQRAMKATNEQIVKCLTEKSLQQGKDFSSLKAAPYARQVECVTGLAKKYLDDNKDFSGFKGEVQAECLTKGRIPTIKDGLKQSTLDILSAADGALTRATREFMSECEPSEPTDELPLSTASRKR